MHSGRNSIMVKMHRASSGAEIDLIDWGFAEDHPKRAAAMTKLLREEFKENPPQLDLPFEWSAGERPSDGRGGRPVDNPLTIYLELPLGPTEDEHPTWQCTLGELIDHVIEMNSPPDDETIMMFAKMAEALRAVATQLDDASKK